MVICTRRKFIKTTLSIPFFLPSLARGVVSEILLPTDCFSCELSICFCGFPPHPAIKVKYWFPVGFLEANSDCEFMSSLVPIVGSFLQSPLKSICKALPFITEGMLVQNYPSGYISHEYMRVHARWYSIPKQLRRWIETILLTEKLCPCIGLSTLNDVFNLPIVEEGLNVYRSIEERLKSVEKALKRPLRNLEEKIKDYLPSGSFGKAEEVLREVQALDIPVWFTELVSPIWMIDILSPDNHLAQAIANTILNIIQAQNPVLGVLSCPYLTEQVGKYLPKSFLFDPEFLCVGHWGRGYPRVGVVRHDDPSIAQLLALARFHHLFSRTFPIIKPAFTLNPSKMKYQVYKPVKTECFRIGYWGIPDIYDLKDVSSTQSLVKRLKRIGWSSFKHALTEAIERGRRRMFVIVWYRESRCCC